MDEIEKCLSEYKKSTLVSFKEERLSNQKKMTFDEFNKWMIELIKDKDNVSIERGLCFLMPSSDFPIIEVFKLLYQIKPRRKIRPMILKTIKHINSILQCNREILIQFAKCFNSMKSCVIHFMVLGNLIKDIETCYSSLIIIEFTNQVQNLDKKYFFYLNKFVNGISYDLFINYLRRFLDQQLIRNPESFIVVANWIISQLNFSMLSIPHNQNLMSFVESISLACKSKNNKLANQAAKVVKVLSSRINPLIFPLNSKSIQPYFSSVEITKLTVNLALSQLRNNYCLITKQFIFSFLTKAILKDSNYLNAQNFVDEYLFPENQFQYIYYLLDLINRSTVIAKIKNQNSSIITAIKFKLNLIKANDIHYSSIFVNMKSFSNDDVFILSDLLYKIRYDLPETAAKFFVLLSQNTKHFNIVINAMDNTFSDSSINFISELFNNFRTRLPNELKIYIPLLKKHINDSNISDSNLAFIAALGVDLKFDRTEIVGHLFSLIKEERWFEKAQNAILKLLKFKESRTHIVKILSVQDSSVIISDFFNVLVEIFKNFKAETDRCLYDKIFNEYNNEPNVIINILEKMKINQFPHLLVELLRHCDNEANYSRKFYFSFLPKIECFTEFDFLLYLPFYPILLHDAILDKITETVSNLLCKFEYMKFPRGEIVDLLEKIPNTEMYLAHMYASDKLSEISDIHIANELFSNENSAKIFNEEMKKYGDTFNEPIIAVALSKYHIYTNNLPSFSTYIYLLLSLTKEEEIFSSCISDVVFYHYDKISKDEIISVTLSKLSDRPGLILLIISKLTSIGNKSDEVFNFLISLKTQNIIPTAYNSVVKKFLLQKYSDAFIDKFLSQSNFSAMPNGTLPSLISSLKNSKRSVNELIEIILKQCHPKSSDQNIKYLISMVSALRDVNKNEIKNIANKYVREYSKYKKEYVSLLFCFSNIENKMDILKEWMIFGNEKQKNLALTILRYLFNFESETQQLHTLLKNIILTTQENDTKLIEATTNALCSAGSSLNIEILTEITPYVISIIKPELSRNALQATISFLTVVEMNHPLFLLKYFVNLFTVLQEIRSDSKDLNTLLSLLQQHLRESNSPPLIEQIIKLIQENKERKEILEFINKNIKQMHKCEILTSITFSLIQNTFNSSDLDLKKLSYSILSSLNYSSQDEFVKAIDIFYKISSESHRKDLIIYFKTFLENCSELDDSLELKTLILKTYLSKAESSMDEYQSNGLSLLFESILVSLNNEDYIMQIVDIIKNTKKSIFRETLISSLIQMFESKRGIFKDKIITVSACIFSYANQKPISSSRNLKRIINLLQPDQYNDFIDICSNYFYSSSPDVRDICIDLMTTLLKSIHKTNNLASINETIARSYQKLGTYCYALTFDNDPLIVEHAKQKLLPLIEFHSKQYDLNYINNFINSKDEKIVKIGICAMCSIIDEYIEENKDCSMIFKNWYNISKEKFEPQLFFVYEQLLTVELRAQFSKEITNLNNLEFHFFEKLCEYLVYSFLDSKMYIDLIPIVYQKCEDENKSTLKFANTALNYLLQMSQSSSTQSNNTTCQNILNDKTDELIPRSHKPLFKQRNIISSPSTFINECTQAFISLAVLMENEAVVNCISSISPLTDSIILLLINEMSSKKPTFFIKYSNLYTSKILTLLFSEKSNSSIEIVQESFINLLSKLNPSQIKLLLEKVALFFLSYQPLSESRKDKKLFNDGFISSIIKNLIDFKSNQLDQIIHLNETLPVFALFICSIFQFISEDIRRSEAENIINTFLSNMQPNNFDPYILSLINLFLSYIPKNLDVYVGIILTKALSIQNVQIELKSEIFSLIDLALALSINTYYLISLIISLLDIGDILTILEALLFTLKNTQEELSSSFLKYLLTIISPRKEDQNLLVKSFAIKIISSITSKLPNEYDRNQFINDIIPIGLNDPLIFCTFLSEFKNIEELHPDYISIIQRYISSSKIKTSSFLSIIPTLTKYFKKNSSLFLECLNFLVRGLKDGTYITPYLCIEMLKFLINLFLDDRPMDMNSKSAIVTGIYFSIPKLSNELKQKAIDLLKEIFLNSKFKESYFETLDSSVLQAIQRDFGIE